MTRIRTLFRALREDRSGVALLEFAFTLPIFLLLSLTGAELTNYITTRMRVAQIALHLADNAARMGSGSQLAAKTITETDINDLFTGANLQSGELALSTNGRVILSDIEVDSAHSGKYKIAWQRCYGSKTSHASTYGTAGQSNLAGVGPSGRQATAPSGGATMFVEVYYVYQPLVKSSLSPTSDMTEVASMMVRDTRDLTQIYNTANATKATC
jgi:Flp pilus assembly protein TadG